MLCRLISFKVMISILDKASVPAIDILEQLLLVVVVLLLHAPDKRRLLVKELIKLHFLTGKAELFGLQNFGATFTVPGVVTIGPNFRVLGQLQGTARLHGQARVDLTLAEWDVTYQVSDANGRTDDVLTADKKPASAGVHRADPTQQLEGPKFYYDVSASGELSLMVRPNITLSSFAFQPCDESISTLVKLILFA